MTLKVQVTDVDRGFKTVLANLSSVANIELGVFGAAAKRRHPDHGDKGAITVGQVAAMLEFGLGGQKQRSFLRAFMDANESALVAQAARVVQMVARGLPPKVVLSAMATSWVEAMRVWVAAGNVTPPNTPATVKWKGHDIPAIGRTGAVMDAVSSRVTIRPGARKAAAGLAGWLFRKAKGG